jgi:DnaD/phage-associated family protein
MARTLNILESDFVTACQFWAEKGMVGISGLQNTEAHISESYKTDERPNYTVHEITRYMENYEISGLFNYTQQQFGRLLKHDELSSLFGLYDWLGLPVSVIKIIIEHCVKNEHRNVRYIEKVCLNCAQDGVDSDEKATEYINRYSIYHKILKAYGHTKRNPTKPEIKYMSKWLGEYGFSLELIIEACERTILAIGEPKFAYTEKILKNWLDKGVKTIEDADGISREMNIEYRKNTDKQANGTAESKPKNKFINFQQRDIDYDELENMLFEHMMSK